MNTGACSQAADALVDEATVDKLCQAMRGPLHTALSIPHPFPGSTHPCDQVAPHQRARFDLAWASQVRTAPRLFPL